MQVNRRFSTCNFSLILRGRGVYLRHGKSWRVQAPCVITQWPGEHPEYGPAPGETWDEVFIVYDASLLTKFQEHGFVDMEKPVWPIADYAMVLTLLTELEWMSKVAVPERVVDHLDRLCERIILSTWLPSRHAEEGGPELSALLAAVRGDLSKPVNLEKEASRQGMSASTFRRRWATISDLTPTQYIQQLRLREACRLLIETNLRINEIAGAIGFEDMFYFSRRFRKETSMSPREYRKMYHPAAPSDAEMPANEPRGA